MTSPTDRPPALALPVGADAGGVINIGGAPVWLDCHNLRVHLVPGTLNGYMTADVRDRGGNLIRTRFELAPGVEPVTGGRALALLMGQHVGPRYLGPGGVTCVGFAPLPDDWRMP